MCHLVQAMDSVSQTGNDMSPDSESWMAICHVLSHPANGRITAKPGVMDSSHATSLQADPRQENELLCIYSHTLSYLSLNNPVIILHIFPLTLIVVRKSIS